MIPKLRLRALDNLQVATMSALAQSTVGPYDFFVTNDEEILNLKEEILELSGAIALSSEQLVQVFPSGN